MNDCLQNQNIPCISVVMPVHNAGKYLSICLETVLNQTYCDFELIAIDDASTDESYRILKEFKRKDNRLKLIHNSQALGAARSRNCGLYEACGKYIIFLDADDYFELDYFENMVSSMETTNVDVAICTVLWRDERFGTEDVRVKVPNEIQDKFITPFSPSDYDSKIFYCTEIMPFNKIIRRDFLKKTKIDFQDISNCNDMFFGFMVLAEAEKMVYLNKPFIHYRYNTGNQISTGRYKKPLCVCYAFEKIRRELIARGKWGRFYRLYNDMAVSSLFFVARKSGDIETIINYVQGGEDSCMGVSNLKRNDFILLSAYLKYRILFYGKKAILGDAFDIISFVMKTLMHGGFYEFRLLVEACVKSIAGKFKRIV